MGYLWFGVAEAWGQHCVAWGNAYCDNQDILCYNNWQTEEEISIAVFIVFFYGTLHLFLVKVETVVDGSIIKLVPESLFLF